MKDKIKKYARKMYLPLNTFSSKRGGWGNGYVGVPLEHPWFDKHYYDIDLDIHGGLTYSDHGGFLGVDRDLWWVGFNTFHFGDGDEQDEEFVRKEIDRLYQMAVDAIPEDIK